MSNPVKIWPSVTSGTLSQIELLEKNQAGRLLASLKESLIDNQRVFVEMEDGTLRALAWEKPVFFRNGDELPSSDIGPIYHDDYASWMNWCVFDQNGAEYSGYASINVGQPMLDGQPVARVGYITTGGIVTKNMYPALLGWAKHHGLVKPFVNAAQVSSSTGSYVFFESATSLYLPVLGGQFFRAWQQAGGADANRVFGSWQNHSIQEHTHYMTSESGGHDNIVAASDANHDGMMGANGVGARGDTYIYVDGIKVGNVSAETRGQNTALLSAIKF